MEANKKTTFKKLITYVLGLCALCEIIITQYFNFFEPVEHMGIDCSWEYLKVEVMTRVGGLFPKEVLSESTSPGTDKLFALMVPINKLIGNIWVSFGLGTLMITLISLFILWTFMERIGFDILTKIIVINLFLCPYLSNGFDIYNDLGYYSCIHGVPGYQNTLVLLFLLMLLIISFEDLTRGRIAIIIITLLLFIYKGLTSGISVVLFCGTPALFFVIAKALLENDIKVFFNWKAIFLYIVNVSIIIGRVLGSILGYSYGEAEINWTTAPDFFENIQHEFLGYMLLVGAVPGSGAYRSPTSLYGTGYMFGLIIFVIIIVATVFGLIHFIKNYIKSGRVDDVKLIALSTIIMISIQFALLKTNAAQDIFETRYLINALICGFLLVGYFIEKLDDKLLFKQFGILVLTFAIGAMNLFSSYIMAVTDNRSFKVEEIQAVIENTDAGLVYFWEEGKVLLPTYEVIRVTDFDRVYKSINGGVLQTYGQYKYYNDSTEYVGSTVLVIENDNPAPPKTILNQYEHIVDVGNVGIYYCENNPIDIKNMVPRNVKDGN